MSDSEHHQLHVPYCEYHSKDNSNSTTLIDTNALVDLSVPLNSITIPVEQELSNLLPEIEFSSSLSTEQSATIGVSSNDRESQPLLGRLELDATLNRFPGKILQIF